MRFPITLATALLLAAACGCSSEPRHHAGAYDGDPTQSDMNFDASGTPEIALDHAAPLRERGSRAESAANEEHDSALADKATAANRQRHAHEIAAQARMRLVALERTRDSDKDAIDASKTDLDRATFQARLDARDAEITALEQEVRAASFEQVDSTKMLDAANARLATAEEKHKLAKLLDAASDRRVRADEQFRLDHEVSGPHWSGTHDVPDRGRPAIVPASPEPIPSGPRIAPDDRMLGTPNSAGSPSASPSDGPPTFHAQGGVIPSDTTPRFAPDGTVMPPPEPRTSTDGAITPPSGTGSYTDGTPH